MNKWYAIIKDRTTGEVLKTTKDNIFISISIEETGELLIDYIGYTKYGKTKFYDNNHFELLSIGMED